MSANSLVGLHLDWRADLRLAPAPRTSNRGSRKPPSALAFRERVSCHDLVKPLLRSLALLALVVGPALASDITGRGGPVGRPLEGARVSLLNLATGAEQTAQSDRMPVPVRTAVGRDLPDRGSAPGLLG